MLITTALQEYLNNQNTKPSTKGVYQGYMNSFIVPYFETVDCSELSAGMIEGFAENLAQNGQSATKIKAVVGFIKKGLKGRYERDIFSLDIKSEQTKTITALSLHEQKMLEARASLSDLPNKVGVFLCLYTGIKTGELCGLMWQDINFEAKLININRAVQRVKNIGDDSFTKTKVILTELTGKSKRCIPIPDFLADLLYEHKKLSAGKYVISKTACPVEPRVVQYKFKNLLSEAGLAPVNFIALRHTFAIRALENDFCITALSEILGHASPVITFSRYADSYEKMDLKRYYMVRFADRISGF